MTTAWVPRRNYAPIEMSRACVKKPVNVPATICGLSNFTGQQRCSRDFTQRISGEIHEKNRIYAMTLLLGSLSGGEHYGIRNQKPLRLLMSQGPLAEVM